MVTVAQEEIVIVGHCPLPSKGRFADFTRRVILANQSLSVHATSSPFFTRVIFYAGVQLVSFFILHCPCLNWPHRSLSSPDWQPCLETPVSQLSAVTQLPSFKLACVGFQGAPRLQTSSLGLPPALPWLKQTSTQLCTSAWNLGKREKKQ